MYFGKINNTLCMLQLSGYDNRYRKDIVMKQEYKENTNNTEAPEKKKVTSKQIVALAGVFLLVLLYLVTLITAIFDRSATGKWFMICLIGTIVVPLLVWIYTWMYGVLSGKRTVASFTPEKYAPKKEEEQEEK